MEVVNLKNPPLFTSIFTIYWHLVDEKNFNSIKKLFGQLFSHINTKLPEISSEPHYVSKYNIYPETLSTTKLYNSDNESEYIVFGSTFFSIVSTGGKNYEWVNFEKEISDYSNTLIPILKDLIDPHHLHFYMEYFNIFMLDGVNLTEKLKLLFDYDLHNKVSSNLGFADDLKISQKFNTDFGSLLIDFDSVDGKNEETNEIAKALVMKLKATSNKENADIETLLNWAKEGHSEIRNTFRSMISEPEFSKFI